MSESALGESQPLDILDEQALKDLLESRGFDTSRWGEGPTKSVADLWHELDEGESEIISAGPELIRRTHVAAVDVTATLRSGQTYRLFEEKQVYKNGGERRRNLITSLAEKTKPGEDTELAVRRAVAEELGISAVKHVTLCGEQVMCKPSATFNGMSTQLLLKLAQVEIYEADFKAEGYVEEQASKSVYLKWEPMTGDPAPAQA